MKRLVRTLVAVMAIGGMALLPLAPAAAAGSTGLGSATAQLGVPASCTFPVSYPVTYTWTGFAGNNDTAVVWIGDSLYGADTSNFELAKVRGSAGTLSHTFGGLVPGASYQAWGELLDGHGNVLLGSLTFSPFGSC